MALKADYRVMKEKANNIQNIANELNTEITEAFKAIEETHSVWHGDRYLAVATKFYNIVKDVNDILDLVVEEIPYTLGQIAANYEAADSNTDAVNVQKNSPIKVSIELPGEEVFWLSSFHAADPYKSKASNCLDGAVEKMTSIQSIVEDLDWEGTASSNYKERLSELKTKLTTSFEDIKMTFETEVNNANEAFEKAENANNIAIQ